MKKTLTNLLVLSGLLTATSNAFANEKYYVECTSENANVQFATFGKGHFNEHDAIVTFKGKSLDIENFRLFGAYQYYALVENYMLFFNTYPKPGDSNIPFSISKKKLKNGYQILESGFCNSSDS
jgi:hypothetical protein